MNTNSKNFSKVLSIAMVFMFVTTFIPHGNVEAHIQDDDNAVFAPRKLAQTVSLDTCNEKDPYAPCTAEVYGSIITYRDFSQTITCGVDVKNYFGTTVARMWGNVPVTWTASGHLYSGTSRGTWVTSGLYYWSNLSGPSPSSGSGGYTQISSVKTNGTINYINAPYASYQVVTRISGTETSPSWSCSLN